jgi:alanine dehydrogenase
MKIGIIQERKNLLDRRVVFSPFQLAKIKQLHQDVTIKVESSDIRIFSDDQYKNLGIEVSSESCDCDFYFGINAIPIEYLIPNKSYFFFSNILEKQTHSKQLLKTLLKKNIDFYDYETLVDSNNRRLIGLEKQAGIVGAYNAIRAFGLKFELFKLPKAETLSGKDALINHLKRLTLPPLKFVITGTDNGTSGIKEVLNAIKIKEVSIENYLTKNYSQAVYTSIDVLSYNKRRDGQLFDFNDFFDNPQEYESNFERFTKVSDIFFNAHFHTNVAPQILTREMLLNKDCKIKVVADILSPVNGLIACTLRSSTIAEPLYGYWPSENKEVDVFHPAAIVVMAVDNLTCELPKDTSEVFGEMLMQHVIPAFFDGDKEGILKRAKITEKGKLTQAFSYLQDYIDGK